ncbi:transcriptional regulator (plasmid) [Halostagnicola larsenii XH-48]|uniref:Transcriptional regulator n=1 Tax=Halostagnicola larsenii XH-48 TaxID=797299 RepID=W0JVY6_9EURY|nr:Lrp/AsnC family transcriptional regulator [Halostagnicola larsenii]AHG01228.1 transcriptional regulator [Halostagnicola larsenii XH-48]
MDERDAQILIAISELETSSSERISEETDIPTSTVHYRIQKLREQGIIKNDLYEFDLAAAGLEITVISEVIAVYDEEYHNRVGEQIGAVEGVKQVFFTMGDVDFVVISRLTDRDMVERMFSQFEAIDGIQRTMSNFVISTIKDDYDSFAGYEVETLRDADDVTE